MSNRKSGRTAVTVLAPVALVFATAFLSAQQDTPPEGSPLAGIASRELELFRLGRTDFLAVETAAEGLGPRFNGSSCAQCHNIPAVGGTGTMVEMRAGYRDDEGRFHAPPDGTLVHLFSTAPHSCQASIPVMYEETNVIGHRISMPLFGAGLVEAIPDQTLLALADPDDRDGDGIRGRAAIVDDLASGAQRVGRFGWKAQHATLLAFSADAYFNEMGITNDLFRTEVTAGADGKRARPCDGASDPEDVRDPRTGQRGIDNFEHFLRFLAPPTRGPITDEALRGERLFQEVGCSSCHVPLLMTGPDRNPALDRKPVRLYSDLLLHDIGTGDGIEQAAAKGEEIRTPSLWGLRFRRPLLHDGSAATIDQAILRHKTEGAAVTRRFTDLSKGQQADLIAFLKSL
jgi:CxxC motif-containing protein (DUF1111 family)